MDMPLYVDAVLVENGIIIKTGKKYQLAADNPDTIVDLKGGVMIPAFIDAHSHFYQVANSFLRVSLDNASSFSEIEARFHDYINNNDIKPGSWIIAGDFDNNLMPDSKNPSIEELDRLAPENPIVIHHKSGHMGLFNSLALKLLGVSDGTDWTGKGKIEKDSRGLTGYMEEDAFFNYIKMLPQPDMQTMLNAFSRAEKKYASYGITSVQEGMFVEQMIPVYKTYLSSKIPEIDITAYCQPSCLPQIKEAFSENIKKFRDRFKIGGLKIFLDGSPQGRTAWMRSPYEDSEDYCAYPTMTDLQVMSAFELAAKEDMQIIAHCNGDAAAQQFLDCLEKQQYVYPNLQRLRPVIIHGQLIGVDQLPKVKKLNAMISFFIGHVYHWGDVHIKNFSRQRAQNISPAASALRLGIPFTFHQDSPVTEPDMIETIWCATNRQTKSGQILGRQQQISVYNALKAVTVNAAYQYGELESKGSISVGKTADFAVLSQNPLQTPKDRLRDIEILQTYKSGNCIYDRKNDTDQDNYQK